MSAFWWRASACLGAVLGMACGNDSTSTSSNAASSGGQGGAPGTSTTIGPAAATVSSTSTSTSTCLPAAGGPQRPDVIPQNYVPWTCWGSPGGDCVLWSPPDVAEVEPPTWIPCEDPVTADLDCEMMAITWAADEQDDVGHPHFSLFDGAPILAFERRRYDSPGTPESWIDSVVTGPDGPVFATARKWMPGNECGALLEGASGVHATISMFVLRQEDQDGCALLGPDGLAAVYRDAEPGSSGWLMVPDHPLERTYTGYIRHSLDFQTQEVVYDANMSGLPLTGAPTPVGDDILFTAGAGLEVAIFGWRPDVGLVTLERFPGDHSRAAMRVGGDGEQIVWTRGEDRPEGEDLYPTRSIMVSPYTLDPSALSPLRLRADANSGSIGEPWAVGCGFAASYAGNRNTQVVRLEDGRGWLLEPAAPEPKEWAWDRALGITCEHIYFHVQDFPTATIARVRLDSLGEGTPPD